MQELPARWARRLEHVIHNLGRPGPLPSCLPWPCSTNKLAILNKKPRKVPERTKYIIILVGLPGRGKTFLCNKLKCYLNW